MKEQVRDFLEGGAGGEILNRIPGKNQASSFSVHVAQSRRCCNDTF